VPTHRFAGISIFSCGGSWTPLTTGRSESVVYRKRVRAAPESSIRPLPARFLEGQRRPKIITRPTKLETQVVKFFGGVSEGQNESSDTIHTHWRPRASSRAALSTVIVGMAVDLLTNSGRRRDCRPACGARRRATPTRHVIYLSEPSTLHVTYLSTTRTRHVIRVGALQRST